MRTFSFCCSAAVVHWMSVYWVSIAFISSVWRTLCIHFGRFIFENYWCVVFKTQSLFIDFVLISVRFFLAIITISVIKNILQHLAWSLFIGCGFNFIVSFTQNYFYSMHFMCVQSMHLLWKNVQSKKSFPLFFLQFTISSLLLL